ncbi:MAG: aspartate-semialdehyde dehydrogenase [Nannocystaceae bacterium]|nr:aspartate-semialdehyde dehydrogenase [Nannocystaceae bacterium]
MRICILGATGLVGRETLTLVDRAWPNAELDLYASRDQEMTHADRTLPVRAALRLEDPETEGGDLAFVALDDQHSRRYVPRLLELGYRVIDKSNAFRMDPEVPLVVGGVNCEALTGEVKLAANPNCTTIPLTLAIAPLARKWDVVSIAAASYQAISGAGVAALDDFLAKSKAGYERADRLGAHLDASDYSGNTVPHAGKTDDSGFSSEERKLVAESRKILSRPALAVSAQCCRVPVAVGHYINAWIELGESVTLAEVEAVLADESSSPFVRLLPGPQGDGLSALHCVADRDRALVGRIRHDLRDEMRRTLCVTVAADNLRLGAATNAVRAANRWFPGQDADLAVVR